MRYKTKSLIVLIILVFLFACQDKKSDPISGDELFNNKEDYVKANQYLVKQDDETISNYVKRREWDMTKTETGLWYMIYEKGTGIKAKKDLLIEIAYDLSLLDGTPCYSSKEEGNKSFIIGKGGVESGLEEGILFLREGDKALFIIPPHLSHGLLGDQKKIPPRSIIMYDIEVLKISEPKL